LLRLVVLFLTDALKITREYERAVVFRLGRLLPEPKGPGLYLLIPIVDRNVKLRLREVRARRPSEKQRVYATGSEVSLRDSPSTWFSNS
jgi:regulator of protease activity HflC (stomatin/prohibitin superfamily)